MNEDEVAARNKKTIRTPPPPKKIIAETRVSEKDNKTTTIFLANRFDLLRSRSRSNSLGEVIPETIPTGSDLTRIFTNGTRSTEREPTFLTNRKKKRNFTDKGK